MDIVIRLFKESDYEDVKLIMFEAFKNKFNHLMKKDEVTLFKMMEDLGAYYRKPFDGYYVAEWDKQVVGVMVLKWHDPSMFNIKEKISIWHLVKTYGLVDTIKLLSIGMVLEQAVSKGECYVESIAISESARGKGVGSLLLNKGIELARTNPKLNTFALSVIGSNEGAIKLYRKLGLEITKTINDIMLKKMFDQPCFYYMSMSLK